MRIIGIEKDKPEVLELRWMWLPTFIGQNQPLLAELGKAVTSKFPPPYEATEEKLDEIHDFVINWLVGKIQIAGLENYLRAIEDVGDDVPDIRKRMFLELRQVLKGVKWMHVEAVTLKGTIDDELRHRAWVDPVSVVATPRRENEGD